MDACPPRERTAGATGVSDGMPALAAPPPPGHYCYILGASRQPVFFTAPRTSWPRGHHGPADILAPTRSQCACLCYARNASCCRPLWSTAAQWPDSESESLLAPVVRQWCQQACPSSRIPWHTPAPRLPVEAGAWRPPPGSEGLAMVCKNCQCAVGSCRGRRPRPRTLFVLFVEIMLPTVIAPRWPYDERGRRAEAKAAAAAGCDESKAGTR